MKKVALLVGVLMGTQGAFAQEETTEETLSESVSEETAPAEGTAAPAEESGMTDDQASSTTDMNEEAKEESSTAEAADKPASLEGESLSYIIPESAVLPERVFRFRTIYGSVSSDKSYDGAGKDDPSTAGFELTAQGLVFVLEYGITDRLSAQVLVPWSLGGDVKLSDEDAFKKRADVKAGVEAAVDARLSTLLNQLKAGYGAGWDNNIPALADVLNPQTGEVLIPKDTPIQDGFNAVRQAGIATGLNTAVSDARTSRETKRAEGLGDVEIGAKYALSTVKDPWFDGVPVYTSVSAGFRLNTSDYSKATEDGKIPAGRGTTDLGIRLNADYEPVRGLQLQVENQSEIMVVSGKAYTQPKAAGGEEKDYKRDGMRQIGYTKLVVAPGAWVDPAKFFLVNARFNWDNDPKTKVGDNNPSPVQLKRSLQFGASLDGLNYGIPVQLDYDYVMALASPSTRFATDGHQVQLKLYYKF